MEFIAAVVPPSGIEGESIWFAFHEGQLLMFQDEQGSLIPQLARFSDLGISHRKPHYLGTLAGQHCFAVTIESGSDLPDQFYLQDLRKLAVEVDPALFMLAGRARQILEWDDTHRYCSRCGTPTQAHAYDRAKLCPTCGFTQYPRIAPCIIVLVTRGYEVLLARSAQFPPGMFSTLAGFVEPGETLEMAVHREVQEEVGIKITNLRYLGSQPWPFPHSLMIGYHADYAGGEIRVDGVEIEQADWWPVNSLPKTPPRGSISRFLIDQYLDQFALNR